MNYVLKKFIETGEINVRPKTGRPIKASMKNRRLLCRISTKNLNLTAKEVYEESNLDLYVSIRTGNSQKCFNILWPLVNLYLNPI